MESPELLECAICQCPSDDLRLLSCSHSYCLPCLKKWGSQSQNSQKKVTCPECRQVTELPKTGVMGLSKGISMRVAKELLELARQPSTTTSSCHFCGEQQLKAFCKQCRKSLCEPCANKHTRKAVFRQHELISAVMMCDEHAGESLEYYCYECSLPLCVLCVQDHEHDVVPVQQAFDDFKQKIQTSSPDLEQIVQRLKSVQGDLRGMNYAHSVKIQHDHARDAIKQTKDKAIGVIHQWEEITLAQVQRSLESKQEKFKEKMEGLDTACEVGTTLMGCVNALEGKQVLFEGNKFEERANKIKEFHGLLTNYVPETIKFKPIEDIPNYQLGELHNVLMENWYQQPATAGQQPATAGQQEQQQSQYPDHVYNNLPASRPLPPRKPTPESISAVTGPRVIKDIPYEDVYANTEESDTQAEAIAIAFDADQDIVASDMQGGCLLHFSQRGTVRPTTEPGSLQPRGLAISANGSIYSCDAKSKTINMFDQYGNKLSSWHRPELSFPKGIATLKNGDLVVTDRDLCKIFIYTASGKLQRSFGHKGTGEQQLKSPAFVTVDSQDRILVADSGNKAIKVFASSSIFIRCIRLSWPNVQSVFSYQSICTDEAGSIYVAQKSQNNIAKYTHTGTFDCMCIPEGLTLLKSPCALAMGKHGQIAVSEIENNHRVIKIIKLT